MPKFPAFICLVMVMTGYQTSRIRTVRLEPVEETGMVMSCTEYLLGSRMPTGEEQQLAREMKLDSFAIFEFDHKLWEKEQVDSTMEEEDLALPAVDLLDAQSTFLAGYKGTRIVLIADVNNNNSLADDEVINVNKALLRTQKYNDLAKVPHVELRGLRTIYNGHDIVFSKAVYILPDTIRDRSLNLVLISNEQSEGTFKYKKDTYIVRARQPASPGFVPVSDSVLVRIDSAMCPARAKFDRTRTGFQNDTLMAGQSQFVVTAISPFMDRMNITAVPKAKVKKKSRN